MAYNELVDRIRIMHKACMHERMVETELNQVGNPEWREAIKAAVRQFGAAAEGDWQAIGTQMGVTIRALESLQRSESLQKLLWTISSARREVEKLQELVPCPSVLEWPSAPNVSQPSEEEPGVWKRWLAGRDTSTLTLLVRTCRGPVPPDIEKRLTDLAPSARGFVADCGERWFVRQRNHRGIPAWTELTAVEVATMAGTRAAQAEAAAFEATTFDAVLRGRTLRRFESGGITLRVLVDSTRLELPAGLTAELRSRPNVVGTTVKWEGREFVLDSAAEGPTWVEQFLRCDPQVTLTTPETVETAEWAWAFGPYSSPTAAPSYIYVLLGQSLPAELWTRLLSLDTAQEDDVVDWQGRWFIRLANLRGVPAWKELPLAMVKTAIEKTTFRKQTAVFEASREWRPFVWQDDGDTPRQGFVKLWPDRPLSGSIQALLTKKRDTKVGNVVRQGDRCFTRETDDPQGYPRWLELKPNWGAALVISGEGANGELNVVANVHTLDDTPLSEEVSTLLLRASRLKVGTVRWFLNRRFQLIRYLPGKSERGERKDAAVWQEEPWNTDLVGIPQVFSAKVAAHCPNCKATLQTASGRLATLLWRTQTEGGYAGVTLSDDVVEAAGDLHLFSDIADTSTHRFECRKCQRTVPFRAIHRYVRR